MSNEIFKICRIKNHYGTVTNFEQQYRDAIAVSQSAIMALAILCFCISDMKTVMSYKIPPFLLPSPPRQGMKRARQSPLEALNKFFFSFDIIRAVTSYGAGGPRPTQFLSSPPQLSLGRGPRFSQAPQFVSGTAVELQLPSATSVVNLLDGRGLV